MSRVSPVPASAVRPLRSKVLRPGQPPQDLVYPGDDAPLAYHAGGMLGDRIHGIATVYPEAPPEANRSEIPAAAYAPGAAFRLRGMATSAEARGTGLGRDVLEACYDHVRASGARFLWCNARLGAVGFYEKMGLRTVGDEFDIPGIGPHYVMWGDVSVRA